MTCVFTNKTLDKEQPVPSEWRSTLKYIADEFVSGRAPQGNNIRAVEPETLKINVDNISDYPDTIGPLQDVTWSSSIHVWTGDHWEILLDLSTKDHQTSDLVLRLRVYDVNNQCEFEPGLIYVP